MSSPARWWKQRWPMAEGRDLPDVNVLLALTNRSHQHFRPASEWFLACAAFATTPVTELGLVRLLLNPAVTGQPVDTATALEALRRLRAHERHSFLADSTSLADLAIDSVGLVGHNQVTDFHLLNLAVSCGARLVTFDRRLGPRAPDAAASIKVLA